MMQALSYLQSPFHRDASHDRMACTIPHPAPLTDLQVYDSRKRKRPDAIEDSRDSSVVKRSKYDGSGQVSRPETSLPSRHLIYTPTAAATDAAVSTESFELGRYHPHIKAQHQPMLAGAIKPPSSEDMSQGSRQDMLLPTTPMSGMQDISTSPSSLQAGMTKGELSRMKIESLFNLEILFKCEEARLIDQEIAKTQIALEQIRRCQLIPFPGQSGSAVTTEEISTHSGPSLAPAAGLSIPQSPAPWGVVDGPYSQHYSHWLIQDRRFDASPIEDMSPRSSKSAHATRHSFSDRPSFSASRAHRQSTGSKLQALTTTSPVQRERAGPLVIKRQSDGQVVKLVCKFCGKADSNSVQGFLNHCRIAHQKMYESHNAAALECGLPLTANDTVASPVAPSPTATVAQNPVPLRMPINSLIHQNSGSSLHNTSAPARPSPLASRPQIQAASPKAKTKSKGSNTPLNIQAGPFVPSAMTPHLSTLMQKRGLGGDLSQLVTSAKQRCDMSQVEQLSADDDTSMSSQPATPVPASVSSGKRISMAPHAASNKQNLHTIPENRIVVPDSTTSSFGPLMETDSLRGVSNGGPRYDIPISPVINFSPSALSPHAAENPGLVTDHEDEDGDDETRSDSHSIMGDVLTERDGHHVRVRDEHGDEEMRYLHDHDESRGSRMQDKEPSGICGGQIDHVTSSVLLEPTSNSKKKRGRSSKRESCG